MAEEEYFVSTRGSEAKKGAIRHEIVSFENFEARKKAVKSGKDNSGDSKDDRKEIDMKRARFEVYKFAQSCLGASEKHQSNVELAVKLGARPPKKKSVNYKELIKINKSTLEENKKQDIIVRMGKQFTTKGKKETKKQSLKRKKRVGDGILNVYGKAKKQMLKK